jgi:hypothetical protein
VLCGVRYKRSCTLLSCWSVMQLYMISAKQMVLGFTVAADSLGPRYVKSGVLRIMYMA